MSQDQRNDIIHECVPDLVKQLTGFDDDDANTLQCVHFGWNIIRNHRNLSTNSHEVRRKIEGIQERFRVENLPEYADYLGRMCDEIVKHPLCVDHYEVDVHWSILDFLFTLAYNPTGALKKNKHNIEIKPPICENVIVEDKEKSYWESALKEDFIAVRNYGSSDSELSDWSDNDDDSPSVSNALITTVENLTIDDDNSIKSTIESSVLGEFKPPKKSTPFRSFDASDAEERLREQIQHSWWNTDHNEHTNAEVESQHRFANFSLDYCRYLSETSNNLIRFQEPCTITEEHVMREILWMFQKPCTCGVFVVDKDNELKIKANVTIPSSGVNAFQSFLEEQFLPYIKMMHALRQFHKDIYNCGDRMPPRTLECYASNLHLHLMPVWDVILEFERRLMEPKDFEINTLITMRAFLNESFRHLVALYELHQQVVIDWRQHPAHIASAFLLANIMNCYLMESDVSKANLYMSLLLAAIKTFCEIIEIWWIDGRLDDWRQEYIVERTGDTDQSVCVREYRKNKRTSFFVPSYVSKIIEENSLFQLMKDHSLEAGRTLNLLYEIKRIGDLRNNFDAIGEKFYKVFIEDFLGQVKSLQADVKKQCDTFAVPEVVADDSGFYNDHMTTNTLEKNTSQISILNSLTTCDSYLLKAFALNTTPEDNDDLCCSNDATSKGPDAKVEINARYIYDILQNSKYSLPLEKLLNSVLNRLLKRRIAFADNFVLQLYRDEFMILKHLRNIRKVLLLEASDIMHQFYSNLFKQIESGETWANPSLLTMQFDDIISSKFADMSSLFSIDINSAFRCRTTKVVEVVEELIVNYSLNRELSQIITQEDMQSYNKVFCFLLKVKWGITTLEKLRFPRSHKRRIPYARFEMIDLIMRRLEQLRFWMMYAIQSIHFHLMTHVLQSMGEQLDVKIENCENLNEMEMVHKSYLSTVCEHCFLVDSVETIKLGVEQLLSLVSILRGEWQSCVKYIESNNNPLAIALDDSSDDETDTNFVANSQIDAMEYTYICCHQYLANILNDQVYLKKKTFLSGLRAAFNTSLPH